MAFATRYSCRHLIVWVSLSEWRLCVFWIIDMSKAWRFVYTKLGLFNIRYNYISMYVCCDIAHSATKNYWKYVCICIYVKMVRWHVLCLNFFIYVVYDITTCVYPTSNFSSYKLLLQLVLTANPTTIVYRSYVFVQRFHKFMSSSSVSAVNLVL